MPGVILLAAILMTNNGFEPKEIHINSGETVEFINQDDANRWPASNFHPTHILYSEFDPQKGIAPGDSWKFRFEKAGTWRMHDHLSPHMTGTIVVLEDPNKGPTLDADPQGRTLTLWQKLKGFFWRLFHKQAATNNQYKWLEELAEREGPEEAWNYLVKTYNTPQGVVGNPHDMAHLVGQLIFKKHGFDGLSICEPLFAFGCYHGLMEVAFNKQFDLEAAEKGCRSVGNVSTPAYWSCIHGIGHGVATFRDHKIDQALADCDIVGPNILTYCYDGVFMEFSISAPPSFYKQSDPLYPCNAIGESYKSACARSQTQVMRLRMGMNTKSIALACTSSGNANIIYHCTDALGYFIGQNATGLAGKVVRECGEIEDEKQALQCLSAAAGELVFQNAAGWQSVVKEICRGEKLCEERVDQVKKSYGRD